MARDSGSSALDRLRNNTGLAGGSGGETYNQRVINSIRAREGLPPLRPAGRPADPNDPLVYMDLGISDRERTKGGISPRAAEARQRGKTMPRSQALAEFYNWSDNERRAWGRYLVTVGRIDEDEADDYEVLKDEWAVAVDEAANFAIVGKKVSPWQAAKMLGGKAGATDKEQRFTGRKSYTRRQVNLTSPEDARGIVYEILRDQIGRAPTEDEYASFLKVLNDAERANPTTTTETTAYEDGEAVSSEVTTTGGIGQAGVNQLLLDRARRHPDYGAYQAATRLYNALINDVVRSPV